MLEAGASRLPHPLREGTRLPTLPPGGRMGQPGFPSPLRTGCARTFPGARGWGNPVSQAPCVRA